MKHFLRHGPWKNFKDYLRFSSGWYNFAWSFSKWDKLGLMPRRGAWVAETTGLLNQHTSNCITGSNPVLSAETVPNFGTVFFFTPCTEITENYIFRKKCNFFSKFIRGTFAEYVFITYICTNDWLFEMLKKNIRFLYGEIGSLLNCRAGQLAPRVRIPSSPLNDADFLISWERSHILTHPLGWGCVFCVSHTVWTNNILLRQWLSVKM